jgi:hypothetical protein
MPLLGRPARFMGNPMGHPTLLRTHRFVFDSLPGLPAMERVRVVKRVLRHAAGVVLRGFLLAVVTNVTARLAVVAAPLEYVSLRYGDSVEMVAFTAVWVTLLAWGWRWMARRDWRWRRSLLVEMDALVGQRFQVVGGSGLPVAVSMRVASAPDNVGAERPPGRWWGPLAWGGAVLLVYGLLIWGRLPAHDGSCLRRREAAQKALDYLALGQRTHQMEYGEYVELDELPDRAGVARSALRAPPYHLSMEVSPGAWRARATSRALFGRDVVERSSDGTRAVIVDGCGTQRQPDEEIMSVP